MSSKRSAVRLLAHLDAFPVFLLSESTFSAIIIIFILFGNGGVIGLSREHLELWALSANGHVLPEMRTRAKLRRPHRLSLFSPRLGCDLGVREGQGVVSGRRHGDRHPKLAKEGERASSAGMGSGRCLAKECLGSESVFLQTSDQHVADCEGMIPHVSASISVFRLFQCEPALPILGHCNPLI